MARLRLVVGAAAVDPVPAMEAEHGFGVGREQRRDEDPDSPQGPAERGRSDGWAPPIAWRGALLFPASVRRLLVAGGLALVVVAIAAVVVFQRFQASAEPLPPLPEAQPVATVSVAPSRVVTLVVDVAGKVRRPGLVRLQPGARVADAVAAAGGALPGVDLSSVNLASRVSDGQQVVVGVAGAPSGGGTAASSGPLSLSSATAEQLDALPGVGPVLAQRIVSYRAEHGAFRSVDDLARVPGIGPSKLADLRALVVP